MAIWFRKVLITDLNAESEALLNIQKESLQKSLPTTKKTAPVIGAICMADNIDCSVPDGPWIYYDEFGKIIKQEKYEDGKLIN